MTHEAGRKDDSQKPRWHLLPLRAVSAVVEVLECGANKYQPENWRKVANGRDRYYDALMRHLVAWRLGEAADTESGLSHLAHVATNALFLLEKERTE